MTDRTWEPMDPRSKLTRKQIAELYLRQDGRCFNCEQKLHVKGHVPVDFIDEHVLPLSVGGTNDMTNRALSCKPCAKVKTAAEAPVRAKGLAVRDKFIGAVKPRSSFATNRNGKWKKCLDGTVERRS